MHCNASSKNLAVQQAHDLGQQRFICIVQTYFTGMHLKCSFGAYAHPDYQLLHLMSRQCEKLVTTLSSMYVVSCKAGGTAKLAI